MHIKNMLLLACVILPFFVFSQSRSEKRAMERQALAQKDSAAKSLTPIEGKAIVYILRPTSFGAIVEMGIDCDGAHIGSTHAQKYVYTILDPGKHNFTSKAENNYSFYVDLEPGKIYYIKQEVKMGFVMAETKLAIVSEEDGKKYLNKCKLSKDNVYQ